MATAFWNGWRAIVTQRCKVAFGLLRREGAPHHSSSDYTVSVKIVSAACSSCNYQVEVGVGSVDEAVVRVHWIPASCASCGVVSINVYSYGPHERPTCHECGERVSLYLEWGPEFDSNYARPCPDCGGRSLHFQPKVDGS